MRLQVTKNAVPAAAEDFVTVDEDGNVTLQPLFNDTDADGDRLTLVSVTQPAHGWATLNPDGTLSYLPAPDYHGTDAFTYTLATPTADVQRDGERGGPTDAGRTVRGRRPCLDLSGDPGDR